MSLIPPALEPALPPTNIDGISHSCDPGPSSVTATGAPVTVPVGKAVLGRVLDVLGAPQDNGGPLPDDTPRRSIHAPPPALQAQTRTTDVFATMLAGYDAGIFIIDPPPYSYNLYTFPSIFIQSSQFISSLCISIKCFTLLYVFIVLSHTLVIKSYLNYLYFLIFDLIK